MFESLTLEQIRSAFPVGTPWDHQVSAIHTGVVGGLKRSRAINITVPTGGGKSQIQAALINLCVDHGIPVTLYTNRRMLTRQTCAGLERANIEFGVRAASMRHLYDASQSVQISSIMTEIKRVVEQGAWELHKAGVVICDESHLMASGASLRILQMHLAQGAAVIGFTATPIGISHLYPYNFVAANNSDLRKCGAHVIARTYAPHQMDVGKIKRQKTGEYSVGDIRKEVWSQAIVGYIYDDWKRYNPDARQTICFAPGVPESLYIAQRFKDKGVRVIHLDAKNIWVDGEQMTDDDKGTVRAQVLEDWNKGRFPIVTNRFVMREGLDFPTIYHGILATPFGSLKSFIQSVGRIIRRSDATPDEVIITDHGCNIYQHGSPNANRNWDEMYHMSEAQIAEQRKKQMQENPDLEPITCSECGGMRNSGGVCPHCGFKGVSRTRVVVQHSGQLRQVDDSFYEKPAPPSSKSVEQKNWDGIYWQARKSGRTFAQAVGMYKSKYGAPPSWDLSNMPVHRLDWKRKIKEVDYRALRHEGAV